MLSDFKKFMLRGNVIDLAVGVVIGGAFGGIVKSLVDDVIMPPVGWLTGGIDFANLFVTLKDGAKVPGPYATVALAKEAGAITLRYGLFLNTIVNFLIVGTAIYFLVKAISRALPPAPPPPPAATKECPHCAMAIPVKAIRCPHCTSPVAESAPLP